MRRIIQILIRNHVFFTFIILQFISLQILIKHNFIAESFFSKSTTELSGFFFQIEQNVTNYFSLKQRNEQLLEENLCLVLENESLLNSLKNIEFTPQKNTHQANIVNNTWQKNKNFLTINAGSKMGIKPQMGVTYNNNLVGITYTVSDNFTTIISLLNTDLMVSAKIKGSGHYGTLNWNGKDAQIVQLIDIPKHANIKIGDTIITSGYSNTLNKGINIGIVENYDHEEKTNFLKISVKLFIDFTSIEHVYIIPPELKSERSLIEKTIEN